MEQKPSEAEIQVPKGAITTELARHGEPMPTPNPPRLRKKRGAMHIIKVALFMMRNRSEKSRGGAIPLNDGTKSVWKKLVGSVRPLHLQQRNESSPPSPSPSLSPSPSHSLKPNPNPLTLESPPAYYSDFSEDALFSPSASSSRSGADSRYASAVGLNEMVEDGETEEESDRAVNEGEGDNMIDAKAEEFIANFYHQMKLQRMNSMDHYREIRERSLG